jgi:hypothetical protein
MSAANQKQVGGSHYKHGGEEHWDRVNRLGLNYFQGAATKYVERCYLKGNAIQDLQKAVHFLEKLIEIEQRKADAACSDGAEPTRGYVNQD